VEMSVRSFGMVGKTYRSASEAFKDADYATAIWKCETDTERALNMIKDLLPILFFIIVMFGAVILLYPLFQ
jgi:hypothetical protein